MHLGETMVQTCDVLHVVGGELEKVARLERRHRRLASDFSHQRSFAKVSTRV
jgi:hypothetical protein